jgi:transposase
MEQVSVVGLDLAKSVFQVHGANAQGEAVLRRRLTRGQLLKLLKLPKLRPQG